MLLFGNRCLRKEAVSFSLDPGFASPSFGGFAIVVELIVIIVW
jgi:hypothetical protein